MSTTLSQQIDELVGGLSQQIPQDALQAFGADQVRMTEEGVPGGGPQTGGAFPDGDLLDAHGNPTTLTATRDGAPAVVVFYRGAWCPYCNIALRAYEQEVVGPLREQGVRFIALSPQKPDGALTAKETNELSFDVVSDPGNQIATALGITTNHSDAAVAAQQQLGIEMAASNADGTGTIPMPAVAIVDAGGTLRWIDVKANYAERTEPTAILSAAAEVL